MNAEHVMSGLAALRDTIALPDLFGMVVESLGGEAALAASLGDECVAELEQYRGGAGGEGTGGDKAVGDKAGPDLDAMRSGDVARLENIQGMGESFCTWLHAKGEQQMKRDDDAAVDRIRQLSGSFNKAARAVRLSMVLKHEVVGLRPLPQARANQNAPANQNGSGAMDVGRGGARRARFGERRETEDLAELDARHEAEDEHGLYMLALLDAFDKDVADASPEIQAEVKRQSPAVVLTSIAASIPHPNLDRRIADIELGRIWDGMKPRHAKKPESLAPPDWDSVRRERWNDETHRKARAERTARRLRAESG
jgi:hypothetical protein